MFSPTGIGTSCVALVKVSNGCAGGNTLSKSMDPSRSNCDICLEISSVPNEPPVNEDSAVFVVLGGADAILFAVSDGPVELPTGVDAALPGLGPTGGGPTGLDGVGGGPLGLEGVGGGPAGRDGVGGGPSGRVKVPGGGPGGLEGVGGGPSGRVNDPGGGPGGLAGRCGKSGGLDGKGGAEELSKFLAGIGGGIGEPPTASS